MTEAYELQPGKTELANLPSTQPVGDLAVVEEGSRPDAKLMINTAAKVENIFSASVAVAGATACQASLEIGRLLLGVKEELPHGQFERWLKEHILPIGPWSLSTVKRFMAIAKKPNFERFHGDPSAMYLLAKSDTPAAALDEALRLSGASEFVTHARAKSLVDTYKSSHASASASPSASGDDNGACDRNSVQVTLASPAQGSPAPPDVEPDLDADELSADPKTLLAQLASPSPRKVNSATTLDILVDLIKSGEPIGLIYEGTWPCFAMPQGLRCFKAKIPEELKGTKTLIKDHIEQLQAALAGLAGVEEKLSSST